MRAAPDLAGAVPVGVFLLLHLATNCGRSAGPRRSIAAPRRLEGLPWVPCIEVVAIAVPLLLHIGLGVVLGTTARRR